MHERFVRGESPIDSPCAKTVEAAVAKGNLVFADDFHSVDCNHSTVDGGAVEVKDVCEFLRKDAWLRCYHPNMVAIVQFNADAGQNALKLQANMTFFDDPRLDNNSTPRQRRDYVRANEGQKATGVNRSRILVNIPGGKETLESVRWLHDRTLVPSVRKAFPNARHVSINDGAMDNKIAGIDVHSSMFACPYDLYSQTTPSESKPNVERTPQSIADENARRVAEEASPKSKDPSRYHSVVAKPIDFLMTAPGDLEPFWITMPLPSLHILLGEAAWTYSKLETVDGPIAAAFLNKIGVKKDDRHGRSGFTGNDSRKIVRSVHVLRRLINAQKKNINILRALATSMASYDRVVHQVDPFFFKSEKINIFGFLTLQSYILFFNLEIWRSFMFSLL